MKWTSELVGNLTVASAVVVKLLGREAARPGESPQVLGELARRDFRAALVARGPVGHVILAEKDGDIRAVDVLNAVDVYRLAMERAGIDRSDPVLQESLVGLADHIIDRRLVRLRFNVKGRG